MLYANTLTHHFALDDYHVIVSNQYVQRGITSIPTIWMKPTWYSGIQYRPLPATMFALEREWGGGSPLAGHVVNVVLYAATCGLLTTLLLKCLGAEKRWIAIAASVLYAAHPVHTEVVANIKSRDEILCLLSLVGTLGASFRYVEATKPHQKKWLIAAAAACIAGLSSKESALTFIGIVPLALYFFTHASARRIGTITAVLIAAGLSYTVFAIFVVDSLKGYSADTPINNSLVAIQNVPSRIATALFILLKYLRILIFPHPLVHNYGYNQISAVQPLSIQSIAACVVVFALLTLAIFGIRKKRLTAFAILFSATTISLSSNLFVLIGATMGERFLFIPSLGFCLAAASVIEALRCRMKLAHHVASTSVALIVVFYSIKTLSRNTDWRDNLTLFSRDIVYAQNSATAHASLGNMLIIASQSQREPSAQRSFLETAIRHLRTAIGIFYPYGYAHGNLALAFDFLGIPDSAIVHYRTALELDPYDIVAATNVAKLYTKRGQVDSAAVILQQAVKSVPENEEIKKTAPRIEQPWGSSGNLSTTR